MKQLTTTLTILAVLCTVASTAFASGGSPFDPIPNAEVMASVAGQFKVTRVYGGDTIRAEIYDPQGRA